MSFAVGFEANVFLNWFHPFPLCDVAYPDYTGDKAVAGTVVVAETDNGIKMFGTVVGLAASGTGGIHIHSGVSCATTADPGGHYFDGMTADPWTTTYTADASGVASVEFEIGDFTLSGAYPVAGRVVVVHDTDGSRIACGVVTPTEGEVVTMGTYPDYTGAVTMAGTLLVKDSEAGLSITGTLGGLEASASGGLHIHSGYTCDVAAGVGGHYFEGMTSDPWTTTYTTDANGYSSVAMELADFTMEEGFPVAARAMVAHASTGARVGCGLVSAVAASATAEGPSYECRISHCGCPGAYTQAWCSDSNSLISSEWCGKSKTNCEDNCHGSYCPYA